MFYPKCCRDRDNDSGEVRVYPGKLQVPVPFCTIRINVQTSITDLINEALKSFGLENLRHEDFRLSEILLDRGGRLAKHFFTLIKL